MGLDGALSHIDRGIYANFHKPSRRTLKHHLFAVEIPKRLFRELNAIAENGRRGDFEQGGMFGRVSKIQLQTFNELVEMDFADYGDFGTFLRARDTFLRFSVIVFMGAKRKKNKPPK